MADTFTTTSTQSWGSRIFASIKSVLVGFVFFIVAFPVLWWNEGRAVQTERSLNEGAGAIVASPADSIDASKEGKLVHMNGTVTTETPVADDALPVEAQAVKLLRKVEMYQWTESKSTETKKNVGGSEETVTTYTYEKEWKEGRVDSSEFEHPTDHQNPEASQFASQTFVADPVKLGAHKLSPEQLAKLETETPYKVPDDAAEKLPAELKEQIKVGGGRFYMGEDENTPAVGDVRITYATVMPGAVSIAAVQTGDTFSAYQAKEGDSILLVQDGTHTAEAMFAKALSDNTVFTWFVRAIGFIVMFLGIFLVFKPLVVFADVLPFFGTMLGAGIGIFSFLVAAALSFITIAVAWVFVRPVIGISMVVLAIGALFWLLKVGRKKKTARAESASPMAPATA